MMRSVLPQRVIHFLPLRARYSSVRVTTKGAQPKRTAAQRGSTTHRFPLEFSVAPAAIPPQAVIFPVERTSAPGQPATQGCLFSPVVCLLTQFQPVGDHAMEASSPVRPGSRGRVLPLSARQTPLQFSAVSSHQTEK